VFSSDGFISPTGAMAAYMKYPSGALVHKVGCIVVIVKQLTKRTPPLVVVLAMWLLGVVWLGLVQCCKA